MKKIILLFVLISSINVFAQEEEKEVKEIYELQYDPIKKKKCMVLVKKEILPDKIILGNVNAQKFLLVNLSPDKWSDKKEYSIVKYSNKFCIVALRTLKIDYRKLTLFILYSIIK